MLLPNNYYNITKQKPIIKWSLISKILTRYSKNNIKLTIQISYNINELNPAI